MLAIPDRFGPLIERLEAGGEQLTQDDLRRLSQLQVLDVAKLGEDYARSAIQRETDHTESFRKLLEAQCQPNH